MLMPRKAKISMPAPPMESSISDLVKIVVNLGDATKHLSAEERAAFDSAQQSVVEARQSGEMTAELIHVL
jgi:hypothetical protein